MKVLKYIYSFITLFCIAYGFPLAITNIGRDTKIVIIHLIIGGVGVLLLIAATIYLLVKKKKA